MKIWRSFFYCCSCDSFTGIEDVEHDDWMIHLPSVTSSALPNCPVARISQEKFEFLQRYTSNQRHYRKTFMQHLVGVHNILSQYGERQELCDAGLFHSIYGTEFYQFDHVSCAVDVVIYQQEETKLQANFQPEVLSNDNTKDVTEQTSQTTVSTSLKEADDPVGNATCHLPPITRDLVQSLIGNEAERLVYTFCSLKKDRLGIILQNPDSVFSFQQQLDLCKLEYANLKDQNYPIGKYEKSLRKLQKKIGELLVCIQEERMKKAEVQQHE
jgi:hypothetical protein